MLPHKPWSQVHAVCFGPGTQNQGTKCTSKEVNGPWSLPWTRVLAISEVTLEAPAVIIVAALRARPIPGRAARPRAPPPPREDQVAAPFAIPIAWPPHLHQLPLRAASLAPLREAQVHGCALRASPTVSHDPFMLVQLPWVGFLGLWTVR